MTNFIYNMQDELFHLPLEDFSPIKKLVDHIEAQGKQLRELNAAITKRNKTIEKYESEKKDLQERNSCLYKKVVELNNGIRNSEDLTWKQKYEALMHSSEQAISALQKKCQEYKNSESEAEKALEDEKQVSKDLNVIINSKNKLLDEYMTKYNKLEHNYKAEVRHNEVLKNSLDNYIRLNARLNAKITRIGGMCDGIKKIVKE